MVFIKQISCPTLSLLKTDREATNGKKVLPQATVISLVQINTRWTWKELLVCLPVGGVPCESVQTLSISNWVTSLKVHGQRISALKNDFPHKKVTFVSLFV